MADNTTLNAASSSGDVIRNKDRSSVKTQLVGLDLNPNGASEVLQAASALADGMSNPTVPLWGVCLVGWNGTTWDRLKSDTTNGLDVDVTRVCGQTITFGAGAVSSATPRVTHASDDPAVTSLQLIDDPIFVDDAAFTPATSKVHAIGCQADETATDSVDEGDIGCPRMTLDRKQHVVSETEGATVRESGTALTVKRAKISAASSGENTLVSAVASKKIRVLSLFLLAAGTVNAYFDNATDGGICGDSTNKLTLTSGNGFVLPHNPHGWFQTGTNNEALRINLDAVIGVAGSITYVEV